MSSLEKESEFESIGQCSLKRLSFNSKVLRDKVDDNRQVQKVAIEGLQSNLTIDVEAKEVAIEELKSND
jgi:hypothetical protein